MPSRPTSDTNAPTGARRGHQVLKRLKDNPPALWYRGELVKDVTQHPALKGGVETLAHLYDLQWQHADVALYDSPSSGRKVSRAFMMPKTHEELVSISRAMKVWQDYTHGMMGRVPDYISRAMTGYAAGAPFLAEADPRFGANAVRYYEYLRENDLCLTHTLIPPQANRALSSAKQADPFLAARIKEETDAGIVIRGCRMLATLPISDEIMVFPSTLLKSPEEDAPYAFGFSIPNNTPGLRFICRESVDYGRSHFDHPLGSRFEEMDAVVIFDDVFVPWENVLLYRDIKRCNEAYARTGAVAHMTHQVVVKNIAKSEYMLGLASLLANSIGAEVFQHIQEKLAELWVNHETMKAFLRTAEVDAKLDEWGVMRPAWDPLDAARNLFPRLYPRMVEIIQQIGASGLVAMPTEADLKGPLSGGNQALLSGRACGCFRPGAALSAGLGHRDLRVRVAPGAVRAILFRRSGENGGRPGDRPQSSDSGVRGEGTRLRARGPGRSARWGARLMGAAVRLPPNEREYRDTVGLFSTGVAVIVANIGGEVFAMTVNAVASLSLSPKLIMFAPGKHTRFAQRIGELKHYSINLLRSEQQALSTYFAGGWQEAAPPPFRFVAAGETLRLEGCLACIECSSVQHLEIGDHWLVIGEVQGLHRGIEPHSPLLFFKGRYRDMDFRYGTPAPDLAEAHDVPAHIYYPT